MSEGILIFGMFAGGAMIIIMTLLAVANILERHDAEAMTESKSPNDIVIVTDYNKARAKMRKNS